MSTENEFNIRDEILSWMHQNQYTRASFDRLISHVPGCSSYEQLRELVMNNQHIFRPIIVKGGLEGLALITETDMKSDVVNADTQMQQMLRHIEAPLTGMVHQVPEVPAPVYPVGEMWMDISNEEYREYLFRNGHIIRVNHPLQVQQGPTVEGRVGGPMHTLTAKDGMGHIIPAGWLMISMKAKPGARIIA